MYICIALLTDNFSHNLSRKISFDLNKKHGINMIASRLPQHITLKQVFKVDQINEIEDYFDKLAYKIKAFQVDIDGIQLINVNEKDQVLWFNIEENIKLRQIHDLINTDLEKKFGIEKQGFDGEDWHFHSSITYAVDMVKELEDYHADLTERNIKHTMAINQIALFCTNDDDLYFVSDNFYTYKISELNSL